MIHVPGKVWFPDIPDEEWTVYRPVLQLAVRERVPFALGGGFAFSYYTGIWRNTKDLDLYTTSALRGTLIDIISDAGFDDYFDIASYDRSWIYRGHLKGLIMDVIWQMANGRAQVEPEWIERSPRINVRGLPLRVLPMEELAYTKIYVMQRDRCDWPDLLNILFTRGQALDWKHMFNLLGDDRPLLRGLMCVFSWLCPDGASALDEDLWRQLDLPVPTQGPSCQSDSRVKLLDSRPWFVPLEMAKGALDQGS